MLRKATVIAAMLATTTTVAACGGSGPPASNTASRTGHGDVGLKLAECMRSHGIHDFPDPGSGGGFQVQQSASQGAAASSLSVNGHTLDASAPAFRQAMHACQKDLPHGPPITGAQLARIKQGAVKMAECMRSHGVPNFADPQVTTGPGGQGISVRMGMGSVAGGQAKGSPPSPAFQHAMNICQPLMSVGLKRQKATS